MFSGVIRVVSQLLTVNTGPQQDSNRSNTGQHNNESRHQPGQDDGGVSHAVPQGAVRAIHKAQLVDPPRALPKEGSVVVGGFRENQG